MRNAFAAEINEQAARDPRVVLLSGDIGNRLFDPLKAKAPERFFNCGVAEANMMTMAAGMALSGMRPVVYTITPFVTTRCLEQIRVDVSTTICRSSLSASVRGCLTRRSVRRTTRAKTSRYCVRCRASPFSLRPMRTSFARACELRSR